MSNLCINCKIHLPNKETFPWCVKCAYCNNKKHILQMLPDGKVPIHCQICNYKKYLKELNSYNILGKPLNFSKK
jgi:hypothetical protein